MGIRLLRNLAIASFLVSMTLILVGGYFAYDKVPPIPGRVTGPGGRVLFDRQSILRGQDVFQRYALMDHGSIWGHGTQRGMDFAADTLHRVGRFLREFYAVVGKPDAAPYDRLSPEQQAPIDERVIREIHTNRYDPNSGVLELSGAQVVALTGIEDYWSTMFRDGDKRYGFLPNTVPTAEERRDLARFFFWTAWAAGANRPGLDYTYTNNWPPDRSVGNTLSPLALVWSILSIFALLAVLGVVIYVVHRYGFFFGEARGVQAAYRLMEMPVTPSQRATAKFFLVAGLLFLMQILNGGLLANYTVTPGRFYIQTIGDHYSYSWAKTWHLQLAILWIATAWVGTAIYLAPLIAGREPKRQRLLVNLLFAALVLVVGGSLLGEVLSIKGYLGPMWHWLGHQGWEYLELGRLWQVLLLAGLVYWLFIVYRALAPSLRKKARGQDGPATHGQDAHAPEEPERRALIAFYVLSAVLVVAFFSFGLFYGRGTHMTVADYWRWFVVHIWVESIFEFFGVAIVALFLVTLGLVTAKSALRVAYLTAILVFLGGIPGTAHHYFWFGGPGFWLALGGVFSSLEPVPLILLVVRAWMEYRSIHKEGREFPYRWPLYFLVASSFWNFVGAGIFGFMINLPVINYYEHATYLTANHAHTALFGVYGMLAVSLILFSWRGLVEPRTWSDRLLKVSFWGMNGGLFLMFSTSLLPIGVMQVWQSYAVGFWSARSADFWNQPAVKTLAMWRIVPDSIVILFGALPLLWFLLKTFFRLRKS